MAFEISEAQIEKIVEQVLRSLPDASAPAAQWDATGYGGRKFIGIFESMEAAIEATAAGYKAPQRDDGGAAGENHHRNPRLTRAEAETMARLGVAETGMGRVEHKTAKHLLVADKTPGTEDIVSEARTGDHGLTLVEMAPFGLVGSITPSTNPSETVLCNSIGMVARGQRRGLQPSPPRHRHLELRRRPGQPGLQGGGRPRNSGLLGGQAHHGDRQGHADPSRHQAAGLHRRPRRGEGGALLRQEGHRRGRGQSPVIVDDTADIRKAARTLSTAAPSITTCPASRKKRFSPSRISPTS